MIEPESFLYRMADDDQREDRAEDGREGAERMKKKKLSGSENRIAKKKRLRNHSKVR